MKRKQILCVCIAVVFMLLSFTGCGLSEKDVYKVMKTNLYTTWTASGETVWYGLFDDEQRIATADHILGIWKAMGEDTGKWNGNTLAQEMNNYYDIDKSQDIWSVACFVTNGKPEIDAKRYAAFYQEQMEKDTKQYYWEDVDGDIWYWDGMVDEYIGSGEEFKIDKNGNLVE